MREGWRDRPASRLARAMHSGKQRTCTGARSSGALSLSLWASVRLGAVTGAGTAGALIPSSLRRFLGGSGAAESPTSRAAAARLFDAALPALALPALGAGLELEGPGGLLLLAWLEVGGSGSRLWVLWM
jgi:hypothetical protein